MKRPTTVVFSGADNAGNAKSFAYDPGAGVTVEKVVYTPVEAALRIGSSRTKIFEFIKKGELRSFRMGRLRLIHHEDLEGYLASLRAQVA